MKIQTKNSLFQPQQNLQTRKFTENITSQTRRAQKRKCVRLTFQTKKAFPPILLFSIGSIHLWEPGNVNYPGRLHNCWPVPHSLCLSWKWAMFARYSGKKGHDKLCSQRVTQLMWRRSAFRISSTSTSLAFSPRSHSALHIITSMFWMVSSFSWRSSHITPKWLANAYR